MKVLSFLILHTPSSLSSCLRFDCLVWFIPFVDLKAVLHLPKVCRLCNLLLPCLSRPTGCGYPNIRGVKRKAACDTSQTLRIRRLLGRKFSCQLSPSSSALRCQSPSPVVPLSGSYFPPPSAAAKGGVPQARPRSQSRLRVWLVSGSLEKSGGLQWQKRSFRDYTQPLQLMRWGVESLPVAMLASKSVAST